MTLTTDTTGTAHEDRIPAGIYHLIPQPVYGLVGTPAPIRVTISQGDTTRATVSYDTGIR